MFGLPGYDAFWGFCRLRPQCLPWRDHQVKMVAPKAVPASASSPMGPHGAHWRGLDSIQHPLLHVCAGLRHLRCRDRVPLSLGCGVQPFGLLAFIEALIFIAILLVALAYAWRKGALEWS